MTNLDRLKEISKVLRITLDEAADDVLLHYNAYDYNDKDKSFIEFCETFEEEESNE